MALQVGVGEQKILGRVHQAPISIEGVSLTCSFSVLVRVWEGGGGRRGGGGGAFGGARSGPSAGLSASLLFG